MDLSGEINDIKTVFLYGDFEEDIYMKISEWLEHFENIPENCCCNLLGIIYGLVQALRQFFKEVCEFPEEEITLQSFSGGSVFINKVWSKIGTNVLYDLCWWWSNIWY